MIMIMDVWHTGGTTAQDRKISTRLCPGTWYILPSSFTCSLAKRVSRLQLYLSAPQSVTAVIQLSNNHRYTVTLAVKSPTKRRVFQWWSRADSWSDRSASPWPRTWQYVDVSSSWTSLMCIDDISINNRTGLISCISSCTIIICDKKWHVWILFCELYEHHINELRQHRVKYDVHTMSKIKHTCHFLSHIILLLIYLLF